LFHTSSEAIALADLLIVVAIADSAGLANEGLEDTFQDFESGFLIKADRLIRNGGPKARNKLAKIKSRFKGI